MPKFIWLSRPSASGRELRHRLTNDDRPGGVPTVVDVREEEQLSKVGEVSAAQSMSPGFRITSPVVVSYHW